MEDDNAAMLCVTKPRHSKTSKPIPIGSHHTVSGHEASDLAKRLSKELAAQQAAQMGSLEVERPLSPETEPRSRSYDHKPVKQPKGKLNLIPFYAFYFQSPWVIVSNLLIWVNKIGINYLIQIFTKSRVNYK